MRIFYKSDNKCRFYWDHMLDVYENLMTVSVRKMVQARV